MRFPGGIPYNESKRDSLHYHKENYHENFPALTGVPMIAGTRKSLHRDMEETFTLSTGQMIL